jgi:hypothetical protein
LADQNSTRPCCTPRSYSIGWSPDRKTRNDHHVNPGHHMNDETTGSRSSSETANTSSE